MLARLQRVITIALLLTSGTWAAGFAAAGHPVIAALGALSMLFGYAGFLAAEFVAVFVVGDPAPGSRATPKELILAWWGEVGASPTVFFWRQPFRANTEPDSLPTHPDGRRGVLLVHGFVCNRAFWNPWMARLRHIGISFVAVNLEPPFGPIASHGQTIEAAVARLTATTGVPPLVVAHSMGGLAVRHWCSGTEARERIYRVITIGTPHRGTWLAEFSRSVPGSEMALSSTWLARLETQTAPQRDAPFTCFYSNADNVVFPASCATLPHADNRLVRATAHVRLAFHASVFEEALRCLT